MPPNTPEDDFATLESLSEESLAEIRDLLKQKQPDRSDIESVVPEEFLRSLYVYVDILSDPGTSESMAADLAHVRDWFESSLPDLKQEPGYNEFLNAARQSMEEYQLVPTENDDMMGPVLASMGTITGFTSQPALSGSSYTPTLRVFLFNGEKVLLDSTGDWSDWLYLVENLLGSIDEQAGSISSLLEKGEGIEGNLSAQIENVEKRIESIKRFVQEHSVAAESKPKRSKK